MPPRSSATTLRPASASSFDRIPPVQPRPTTTTSTSFKRVAMAPSPQLMSAMLTGARSNFLPRYFSTFSRCTAMTPGNPIMRQPAVERDLRGREADQHFLALLLVDLVERLAVGLPAVRVGGLNAGAVELR